MNSEQKKERRRQNRLRAKQRELQKAQELEEVDSELDVIETADEPEEVEKFMDMPMAMDVEPAPTSFEQLDAMQVARDQAKTVMEVTYATEDLVRNILHDSQMDPKQKASAINAVTSEFANRVSSVASKIAKKVGIVTEAKKKNNSILIEKDKDGNWRWVGWVSNNFVDWDGDIISEDAHKEYVDWWDKNQDVSPVFVAWHTPGTARKSPVDFMMYENGFLITSGPLEEEEAAGLLKAQKQTDLGMSHGTFVFGRDPKDPRVITKYRMYEVSDLPLVKAANPFTDFETIVKEVGMDKIAYLAQILGSEEKAKAFLEKTGLKQKALQEAEIESKEKTEEKVETKVEVKTEVKTEPTPKTEVPAPIPDDFVAKVMKEMDIEGLNAFVARAKEAMEKVPVLEELIKELKGDQEEKLAEKLTPPAARFAWSQENRASLSKENVVNDDEKKKAEPGVPKDYWLSEATKTTPIVAE